MQRRPGPISNHCPASGAAPVAVAPAATLEADSDSRPNTHRARRTVAGRHVVVAVVDHHAAAENPRPEAPNRKEAAAESPIHPHSLHVIHPHNPAVLHSETSGDVSAIRRCHVASRRSMTQSADQGRHPMWRVPIIHALRRPALGRLLFLALVLALGTVARRSRQHSTLSTVGSDSVLGVITRLLRTLRRVLHGALHPCITGCPRLLHRHLTGRDAGCASFVSSTQMPGYPIRNSPRATDDATE